MEGVMTIRADCHYGDKYVAMNGAMTAAELVECLKREFNPSDRVVVDAGNRYGPLKADCLFSGVFQTIDERTGNVPVTEYVPDTWDDGPCDTGIFSVLGVGGAPEKPSRKQEGGPAGTSEGTGWENCGYIPVLLNPGFNGRLETREYTLESRTMPDGRGKYRIRDGRNGIHMVYRNSSFCGGRAGTDSALGWEYVFDGGRYFNV